MKFIATRFLLITAVTGGAYYLLFTPGGNDTGKIQETPKYITLTSSGKTIKPLYL